MTYHSRDNDLTSINVNTPHSNTRLTFIVVDLYFSNLYICWHFPFYVRSFAINDQIFHKCIKFFAFIFFKESWIWFKISIIIYLNSQSIYSLNSSSIEDQKRGVGECSAPSSCPLRSVGWTPTVRCHAARPGATNAWFTRIIIRTWLWNIFYLIYGPPPTIALFDSMYLSTSQNQLSWWMWKMLPKIPPLSCEENDAQSHSLKSQQQI